MPTIVHSVLHGCPDRPVISTYTLRCLLSTINARGSIQFIHLLGRDGWAIVEDRESCRIKALAVRRDLYNGGFVVNEDKSVWEPTQVLDWLGITWNSAPGTLKIVERRIVKISNAIDHIIEADFKVSARESWPPLQVKLFLPGL